MSSVKTSMAFEAPIRFKHCEKVVRYSDYQELENKLKEKDKIIAEYRKVAIDAMSLRFD